MWKSITFLVERKRLIIIIYTDMRKNIFAIIIIVSVLFIADANAQMMMGGFSNSTEDWDEVVEHTAREEQEGKEVWKKFQAKEIVCADLDDEQFGILGEYFMGIMMGDSHAAMNAMLMQMHGEEGEEQIHIALGKRLSGCDIAAAISSSGSGWMPMMNMMIGGWSSPFGLNQSNNSMMNGFGQGFMGGGGLFFFAATWLVWLVVGILAAVWLWKQINKKD